MLTVYLAVYRFSEAVDWPHCLYTYARPVIITFAHFAVLFSIGIQLR